MIRRLKTNRPSASGRNIALRLACAAAIAAGALVLLPAQKAAACDPGGNEFRATFKGGDERKECKAPNTDMTRVYPGKSIVRLSANIGFLEVGSCSVYVKRWGGNFDNYYRAWKVMELEEQDSGVKRFNASTHVDGVRLGC